MHNACVLTLTFCHASHAIACGVVSLMCALCTTYGITVWKRRLACQSPPLLHKSKSIVSELAANYSSSSMKSSTPRNFFTRLSRNFDF